jgi:hypothetical protein
MRFSFFCFPLSFPLSVFSVIPSASFLKQGKPQKLAEDIRRIHETAFGS